MFPWSCMIIASQFIFMTNPCRTATWVWVCVMFCVSDDLCSCGCVNCGNNFPGKYSHIFLKWLLGLKMCIFFTKTFCVVQERPTMGLVWGLCWGRHSGVMSACCPRQTVFKLFVSSKPTRNTISMGRLCVNTNDTNEPQSQVGSCPFKVVSWP